MVTKRKPEPKAIDLKRRRFSVDEYLRMGEAGIIDEDERVELWDGEILVMTPIDSDHSGSVTDFATWLIRNLPDTTIVRIQDPLCLGTRYMPQPDVAVVRWRPDRYHTSHPSPEDTLLVVEVARSSLRYDRDVKVARYAEAAIPEVWILDQFGRQVLVYREPRNGRYTLQLRLGPADVLASAAFPHAAIRVSQVLGSS